MVNCEFFGISVFGIICRRLPLRVLLLTKSENATECEILNNGCLCRSRSLRRRCCRLRCVCTSALTAATALRLRILFNAKEQGTPPKAEQRERVWERVGNERAFALSLPTRVWRSAVFRQRRNRYPAKCWPFTVISQSFCFKLCRTNSCLAILSS